VAPSALLSKLRRRRRRSRLVASGAESRVSGKSPGATPGAVSGFGIRRPMPPPPCEIQKTRAVPGGCPTSSHQHPAGCQERPCLTTIFRSGPKPSTISSSTWPRRCMRCWMTAGEHGLTMSSRPSWSTSNGATPCSPPATTVALRRRRSSGHHRPKTSAGPALPAVPAGAPGAESPDTDFGDIGAGIRLGMRLSWGTEVSHPVRVFR